jgi:hypothetical protein
MRRQWEREQQRRQRQYQYDDQRDQQRWETEQRRYQQNRQRRQQDELDAMRESPNWRDEYQYGRNQEPTDEWGGTDQGEYYQGNWYGEGQQQRRQADQRQRDQQRRQQALQQDQRQRDKQRQQRASQRDRQQMTEMVRKRGTVREMRVINSTPLPKNHTVMRFTLDDGSQFKANFGPKVSENDLPFSQGDRITLKGDKITRNGETFLIVRSVKSGEQQMNLRPEKRGWDPQQRQERRQQSQQQKQGRKASFSGKVDAVAIRTTDGDKTTFRIDLEDSPSRWIYFEKPVSRDQLDISSGDDVKIQGRTKKMDGRTVLVVEKLHVNGERRQISKR